MSITVEELEALGYSGIDILTIVGQDKYEEAMKKETSKADKKKKFRASKVWKEFRHKKNVEQKGIDPITKKKLYKTANLHHLDLDDTNYTNLEDASHFVMINSQTHDAIHWAYKYYKDDPEFLERFKYYLDKMIELNKDN